MKIALKSIFFLCAVTGLHAMEKKSTESKKLQVSPNCRKYRNSVPAKLNPISRKRKTTLSTSPKPQKHKKPLSSDDQIANDKKVTIKRRDPKTNQETKLISVDIYPTTTIGTLLTILEGKYGYMDNQHLLILEKHPLKNGTSKEFKVLSNQAIVLDIIKDHKDNNVDLLLVKS